MRSCENQHHGFQFQQLIVPPRQLFHTARKRYLKNTFSRVRVGVIFIFRYFHFSFWIKIFILPLRILLLACVELECKVERLSTGNDQLSTLAHQVV